MAQPSVEPKEEKPPEWSHWGWLWLIPLGVGIGLAIANYKFGYHPY